MKDYNVYVGARYVPIFDGEWDNKKEYEPLVIVSYNGNSYTSKTYVPIGADINDDKYWGLTGNYNAQVEAYRKEVSEMKTTVIEELEAVKEEVNTTLSDLTNSVTESDAILTALKNNIDFLRNKSILVIGDSLSDEDTQPPNWVARFKELVADINCTINNVAVDGRSLSGLIQGGYLTTWLNEKNDYDYIIFYIGTNDCTGQVPIGKWYDSDGTTFYGALNTTYNTLVGKDNRSKIFWVIPPHTNFGNDTYIRNIQLNVYRSVIVSACNRFKWSIIDAYTHAPFLNPYNEVAKDRWITDGLHPNANYAPYFVEFVVNQLRVGGCTSIGDIPTTAKFTSDIAGASGDIYITYHTNNTFDLSLTINFETPFAGGNIKSGLPAVLCQQYGHTVASLDGTVFSFGISEEGVLYANSLTTPQSSLSLEFKGLDYYLINPPYTFSY